MESKRSVCKGQWSAHSKPQVDHHLQRGCGYGKPPEHMSDSRQFTNSEPAHLRWASTTTFFGSGGSCCAGGFASDTSTVAAAVGGDMAPPPRLGPGAECAAARSVLRQSAGQQGPAIMSRHTLEALPSRNWTTIRQQPRRNERAVASAWSDESCAAGSCVVFWSKCTVQHSTCAAQHAAAWSRASADWCLDGLGRLRSARTRQVSTTAPGSAEATPCCLCIPGIAGRQQPCHRYSGKIDVIACHSCTTVLVFEEVRRPATASASGLLAAGTENYEPLAQVQAQERLRWPIRSQWWLTLLLMRVSRAARLSDMRRAGRARQEAGSNPSASRGTLQDLDLIHELRSGHAAILRFERSQHPRWALAVRKGPCGVQWQSSGYPCMVVLLM